MALIKNLGSKIPKQLLPLGYFVLGFFIVGSVFLTNTALGKSFIASFHPTQNATSAPTSVLAAETDATPLARNNNFNMYVPSTFTESATFNKDLTLKGRLIGPKILSGITAGDGITVGTGNNPTLTNNGVLSIQGEAGDVSLTAGSGITISGLTISATGIALTAGDGIAVDGSSITNIDMGSAQNIFKNFVVDGLDTISASLNDDTFTFASGSGITFATDATTKKLTISADGAALNTSGWTEDGTNVRLTTDTDNVGIGTDSPGYKIDVIGTGHISGAAVLGSTLEVTDATTLDSTLNVSGVSTLNGIVNNGGGIDNAGAITGGTGFTSSGTITLSGLAAGVVHSDAAGILSSAAVDISDGSSEITGILSSVHGGTGLTTFNPGDLLYASDATTLMTLGAGSAGQVLTIATGSGSTLPSWGSVSGGSGGLCGDCLINDPGATQIITPATNTTTGLVVRQASGGSVDIFKITNSNGSVSYFRVDSDGNVLLGAGQTTAGVLRVAPTNSDPIAIAPGVAGGGAFTGTMTSEDLTQDRTWTFPDQSGQICLASGNCAGVGTNLGGTGTANFLAKWQGTTALTNSLLYDNGTNIGIATSSPSFKIDVIGTGRVSGAMTLGSTLNVTGITTLSSTLGVSGATTLSSTLGVSGGTVLSSTLNVSGVTTLSSTLGVTGGITTGGNLTVNGGGTSTFAGGITVTGTTTMNGTITANGSNGVTISSPACVTTRSGIVIGSVTCNLGNAGWTTSSGALYPNNSTWDILAGSTATSSAKFAVLNMAGGTPAVTTTGNVGIGNTSPTQPIHITKNGDTAIRMEGQNVPGISWSGSSPSSGPNYTATGANTTGIGSTAWTNASNITASDDTYSSVTLAAGAASNYIKATNFGFAIPNGSTINGIVVEFEKKTDQGNNTNDNAVRIVKGGSIGSTDKSSALAWANNDAYTSYGSSSDLWGTTWTVADINGSTFGAALSCIDNHVNQARICYVDTVRITIYYTSASGSSTSNTVNWTIGENQVDSGKFKISNGSALGTNDFFVLDPNFGSVGIATASATNAKALITGNTVTLTSPNNSTHTAVRGLQIDPLTISSSSTNQTVTTASSLYIGTPVAGTNVTITNIKPIDTATGAYLSSGGSWTNNSSRDVKENFELLNPQEVLTKISELQVESWNYKIEGSSIKHIGPFAEDFYDVFGVGNDNKHISSLDTSGVALLGIQGLLTRTQSLEASVNALEISLDSLKISEKEGAITFKTETTFTNKTFFESLAEFVGNVIFRGHVSFLTPPTFSTDTAGTVTIPQGANALEVQFNHEYATTPVINLTLLSPVKLDWLRVTNESTKGFTIEISPTATKEILINWAAFAVKNDKIVNTHVVYPKPTP